MEIRNRELPVLYLSIPIKTFLKRMKLDNKKNRKIIVNLFYCCFFCISIIADTKVRFGVGCHREGVPSQ